MSSTLEELKAKANAVFNRNRKLTYLIELEEGESPRTANKMLGAAYLLPGETWPRCEFCGNKMTMLLQIAVADIADVAPGLYQHGIFQVFLCMDMGAIGRDGCCNRAWKWHDPGRNRLARVVVPDGESESEMPPATWAAEAYWTHMPPIEMPTARRVRSLTAALDCPHYDEIKSVLEGDVVPYLHRSKPEANLLSSFLYSIGSHRRPKVGGWPSWLQYPQWPECHCGQTMRMVASLSPYETFRIWSDIRVNVFYCEEHADWFDIVYQNS